jgi:hypothetical protein
MASILQSRSLYRLSHSSSPKICFKSAKPRNLICKKVIYPSWKDVKKAPLREVEVL